MAEDCAGRRDYAAPAIAPRCAEDEDRQESLEKIAEEADFAHSAAEDAGDIGGANIVASIFPDVNPIETANEIAKGYCTAQIGGQKYDNCAVDEFHKLILY